MRWLGFNARVNGVQKGLHSGFAASSSSWCRWRTIRSWRMPLCDLWRFCRGRQPLHTIRCSLIPASCTCHQNHRWAGPVWRLTFCCACGTTRKWPILQHSLFTYLLTLHPKGGTNYWWLCKMFAVVPCLGFDWVSGSGQFLFMQRFSWSKYLVTC